MRRGRSLTQSRKQTVGAVFNRTSGAWRGARLATARTELHRQQVLEQANAAYAALRADPAAWAALEAERRAWDATLGDGLEEGLGQ